MTIKVLQLGSPTGLYGAERWILALVRHLDSTEIESIVASIKDDPALEVPLCREAERLGFKTRVFKAYGRFNLSAVRQLRAYIREHGIDILHTHAYKQDLIGLMAIIGTDCKIISTPHGWSRDAGFKLQCYEALNRAVFPLFDQLVPLSPELYRPLKRIPFVKHKLKLIQNGVDTGEILACHTTAPELIEWRAQGFLIIGYIGRLVHLKGLDILLKAAVMLDKDIPWRIVFVGDGEQRAFLKTLAKDLGVGDKVTFFGFQENRLEFLNVFDLFVLPSRSEGLPRCLMEAMTAGRVVVASDIPGTRELVVDEQTGFLFPSGDAEGLAEKLNWVLKGENPIAAEVAQRGKDFVLQNYSADNMALKYASLFKNIMS